MSPPGLGRIREPAVAGRFYPGAPARLAEEIDGYVAQARRESAKLGSATTDPDLRGRGAAPRLVGVVVPHAGTIYSGPTAGFAYAPIDPAAVDRVVLLGPAHHVPVAGIGSSTARAWRTPLGEIELDGQVAAELEAQFSTVRPDDAAHAPEHSLEVQLPFLQRVLGQDWRLVPLIVGAAPPDAVAAVIRWCAALPRTLIVVSTDLSHYLGYEAALARDRRTIRSIVERRTGAIGTSDACGRHPLRGLLTAADANAWTLRLLDARNSGDTAGTRERVVGYAAFAVTAEADPPDTTIPGRSGEGVGGLAPESRAALLRLARETIEAAIPSGRRPPFDLASFDCGDPMVRAPGAAFVTLRSADGRLLGCIGSLAARRPLAADIAEHAFDAAFRDPRFPAMTESRARGMAIDVSVLSAPQPFPCANHADLLARIPVGRGLVVQAGRHRATFLPAVWGQLPDPGAFVAALWRKAGLAPGDWPPDTSIEVYDCEEFAES